MLDLQSLQRIRRLPDRIVARCPACAATGQDKTGNHLTLWPSGKWCCVVYPGDRQHNRLIWSIAGDPTHPPPPRPANECHTPTPPPPTLKNIGTLISQWANATPPCRLQAFADSIGVSLPSLEALGASWANADALRRLKTSFVDCWAFPMFDGAGEPIGIRLRAENGAKKAVTGSRSGMFISSDPILDRQAYILEGPTDTAAALDLGLFAIGRADCHAGEPYLHELLQRLGIYRAVIVADDDDPGVNGAAKLAASLNRHRIRTCLWIAPGDFREFVRAGGNRNTVLAMVRQLKWSP